MIVIIPSASAATRVTVRLSLTDESVVLVIVIIASIPPEGAPDATCLTMRITLSDSPGRIDADSDERLKVNHSSALSPSSSIT
jgi:Na+/H+-dicarboxylate symporter